MNDGAFRLRMFTWTFDVINRKGKRENAHCEPLKALKEKTSMYVAVFAGKTPTPFEHKDLFECPAWGTGSVELEGYVELEGHRRLAGEVDLTSQRRQRGACSREEMNKTKKGQRTHTPPRSTS